MKVLYLDESGDHDLVHIRKDYPVFVLGGIIVDRTYDRSVLEPRVRAFKKHWLGSEDIVLHTQDIGRKQKGFERLHDPAFRGRFYDALSVLMKELEYQVIACVIDKRKLVDRYPDRAVDPYHHSLKIVVERFCLEIGNRIDGGIIYAERRREELDHELDLAWEELRRNGTYSLSRYEKGQIADRITSLNLKAKRVNIPGLQLADLVISPIGRHELGLETYGNWKIVRGKMCHENGKIEGYGLIRLP